MITITVEADDINYPLQLPAGSTVQQALELARVPLAASDRVEPPLSAHLADHAWVYVTRVKEELYTEQVVLPFEHHILKNEALPEGEQRLSQAGRNGLKEITYRRVYEDGILVSTNEEQTKILLEPLPEIEMVGTRSVMEAIALPGTLAYLSAGNAWFMRTTTGDRELVTSTGDLDGRIFVLSPDRRYLLFTRFSTATDAINSLWLADLESDPFNLIDLQVYNIVHFAAFNPASTRLAYSTSAWTAASPGWRANNDLLVIRLYARGRPGQPEQILEPSSGGLYGWWGSEYDWSPDGLQFLFSHPDSIGIFNPQLNTSTTLLGIMPYQTEGNWAWDPEAVWSPEGQAIYAVEHVTAGIPSSIESQRFDLVMIPSSGGSPVTLVQDVGMFAYPAPSPLFDGINSSGNPSGVNPDYSVAYLQALLPDQSETSTYRLFTIDRTGRSQKALFPDRNSEGIMPQRVAWSPQAVDQEGNFGIALVYNGNIWIIDAGTGKAQQVTADGLTTRIDWR